VDHDQHDARVVARKIGRLGPDHFSASMSISTPSETRAGCASRASLVASACPMIGGASLIAAGKEHLKRTRHLQKLLVTMSAHPLGAQQMAFERLPSPIGFTVRINMQHDARDSTPVRTFRVSV
jgi:hypothetical protein